MKLQAQRIVWTGVVLGSCCTTMVVNVAALDDCDGSTPKQALCGTHSACQAPEQNPVTGEWFCPNQSIQQQFIQHQCNRGPGQGSTLCAATDVDLVCTKRYDCKYSEIENPDTGEVTRLCASPLDGVGVNNSTTKKTDYKTCRDTTGS
jgi:hypothetical protein